MRTPLCTLCGSERIGIVCRCNLDIVLPKREDFSVFIGDTCPEYVKVDVVEDISKDTAFSLMSKHWHKVNFIFTDRADKFQVKENCTGAYYFEASTVSWERALNPDIIPIRYPIAEKYLLTIDPALKTLPEGDVGYLNVFRKYMFRGLRSSEKYSDRIKGWKDND